MQPVGAAVWPLADGRLAWGLAFATKKPATGVLGPLPMDEHTVDHLVAALSPHLTPGQTVVRAVGVAFGTLAARLSIPVPYPPELQDLTREARRLAAIAFHTLPDTRLALPRAYRLTTVPARTSPYLVATAVRRHRSAHIWSYVTGGGWYGTGLIETPSTQLAQLFVATEGAVIFRHHSDLTLIIASREVGEVADRIIHNARPSNPPWLKPRPFLFTREVLPPRVKYIWPPPPPTDHPLYQLAWDLCTEALRNPRRIIVRDAAYARRVKQFIR